MITWTQCPVCKSEDFEYLFDAKDYTVSGENFRICHCSNCTLRFTNPIPKQASIGKYYQSEDYISHSNTSKGLINRIYKIVRNRTLQDKRNLVLKTTGMEKGRALDIGCGTGEFLFTLKKRSWNVTGIEPDEGARKMAINNHGISVFPSEDLMGLPEEKYDSLSMWHVLEHVHELDAYMEKIRKLIKPKGVIIIAVPNYNSHDAEVYGKEWAAYDVPRHLYHFTKTSIEFLLGRHQMKLEDIKIMPYDSFYVSMLSEKNRGGSTLRGFFVGLKSWWHSLSRNDRCSSVIYIIRRDDF